MKTVKNKLEDIFTAISFAEDGEFKTAKQVMFELPFKTPAQRLDEIFTAMTFAEAGEFDTAIEILRKNKEDNTYYHYILEHSVRVCCFR